MSALSYHPVLADVDTVIAAARPDRLLLLGGSVPETMGEAGETRLLLGNSPQLATGVYRFDGEDVAVVVASVGGGPASPSEADWTAADDDPLVNAYGWLAHLWPDAQLVSKPQFGPGDEVLTVPGGQEARVRRRWFSGGSWRYDIRTEGRTVSVREDQVSEPTLDDDPGAWIRRAPAAARGLAATLTRAKLSDRLADTVYSFRATRTVFRPYQFRPVIRLLEAERLRLLIADEVGLGKTIEAGLIWTELDARNQAGRVLVVCPSMLVAKWQFEMEERFGYRPAILDRSGLSDLLDRVETDRLPERYHAICSIERLRTWSGLETLAEIGPRFDLIIADEAHAFRNAETKNHALGALLADWADALVLLSATPLNLGNEDLFTLLGLLSPGDFDDPTTFVQRLQPNAVLNRVAASLLDHAVSNAERRSWLEELGSLAFGPAVTARPEYMELRRLLAHEEMAPRVVVEARSLLARLHALAGTVTRTRKIEIQERKTIRQARALEVQWSAAEADFYRAFDAWQRGVARARRLPVGFLVQMPLRQASSCLPAARDLLLERLGSQGADTMRRLYEDEGDDREGQEENDQVDLEELRQPPAGLIQLARSLGGVDSKFEALLPELQKIAGEGKRVLLFTYSRKTLAYLQERLAHHLRVAVLHGDIHGEERSDVMARFRRHEFDLVVATRVASEGLDFEFCSAVVNYDLPWNPMEVEQRIGRIDRIGQVEPKIAILNFHTPGTIDTDIIERVHQRIGVFTDSIGELEPILQSAGPVLRKAIFDLSLSADEQRQQLDQTLAAIEEQARARDQVETAAAYLSAVDQREIDGLEGDLVTSGRYIGQPELVLLLQDWAAGDPGAKCVTSKDGRWLHLTGTAALADQLRDVQAAGERSADEIGRLASAMQAEREISLCLDQELARTAGQPLLSSTHPLVRAALRTPGVRLARFASARCVSGSAPAGHYLVGIALERWRGVRPTAELWTAAVEVQAGTASPPGVGEALLASLAQAELWDEPDLVPLAEQLELRLRSVQTQLMDQLDRESERRRQENEALVTTRRISLRETHERKVAQIRGRMATMRQRGKTGALHLYEAQLRKQEERLRQAEAELDQRREGSMELEYLAVCLLSIEGPEC